MLLVIPFALSMSDTLRQTLQSLALPNLQQLLARLSEVARDQGDEWSLSTPQERALARALGWRGAEGALPWAARQAAADGVATGSHAWALLSPVHLHLGTDQVSLADPRSLQLDDNDSRVFFEAVSELFTSEGFALHYGAPTRWYAAHASFAGMATASLDRVIGRNVDGWLRSDPAARLIRRLQKEVQMLLYTHPLNEQREAAGLPALNSFWLSGCGVAQPEQAPLPAVDERLREPALDEDAVAWAQAWQALDAGPLAAAVQRAQAGQAVSITLCGERSSATFALTPRSIWQSAQRLWHRKPTVASCLESL
jgi:hypothetical protein